MDNKIKIDLDLSESFEEAKKLLSELHKSGAFKGTKGQRDYNKAVGMSNITEDLIKKGELTGLELDSLDKALKGIFDTVDAYIDKIEDVSKETLWLKEKLRKADAKRESLQSEKQKLRDNIADKKNDFYKELQNKQIKKINKDGTLSQGKALTPSTLIKKFESGDIDNLGYTGADGQVHKLTSADFKELEGIKQSEQSLARLVIVLEKVNAEVDKWENKLESHLQHETMAGNSTVSDSMQRSAASRRKSKKASNKMKDALSANKEKDTERHAHEPGTVNDELKKQETTLGKAFKQFTIYNLVIRAAKSALREATKTITELDKSLTEQAMVTGLTRKETYGLVKSYQDLAIQVGATTKEVAQVATEYMKQGKSIKDSLTLTQAAISAAKVARVSVGDSVNYLTTALNGFRLSADQAMRVSDKFAAVAAASATDYDELAIALSKVASQANLAGMSIDYTTALLTKGLETTREAPETMGTALKTIIARMREMKDYGETLEGDSDINNVESQLQYVGIELRNQQGELRSTEDVLDELGKKWDTLNKNQQAAIAKALAGTRQQSRLIAMMDGYERVTELQEIAQRSAGATASQAEVYLEGMEAAVNNVTVGLEKLVSTVTNSEVLIGLVNTIGHLLDILAQFLSNSAGMITTATLLGSLALTALGHKMMEWKIAKDNFKLNQKNTIELKKQTLEAKRKLFIEQQNAKVKALQAKASTGQPLNAQEQALLNNPYDNVLFSQFEGVADLNKEINSLENKLIDLPAILFPIASLISIFKDGLKGLKLKTDAQTASQTALNVATKWFYIGLAAVAVVGVAVLIGTLVKMSNSIDNVTKSVKKLSGEMFRSNKKADELSNIVNTYDNLDKKVIKTSKDLKDMNAQLEKATDLLSEEERKEYAGLTNDKSRKEFLEKKIVQERENAEDNAQKIVNKIKKTSSKDRSQLWDEISNVDAIRTVTNMQLYKEIDNKHLSKENQAALEGIAQSVINEMSPEELWQYISGGDSILNRLTNMDATTKLSSDESTLVEKVHAYQDIMDDLSVSEQEFLRKAYSELDFFANDIDENVLKTIDQLHLSNEAINDIFAGFDTLKNEGFNLSNVEEYHDKIKQFLGLLKDDASNFEEALKVTFSEYLALDDSGEKWNILVNTIGDHFSTSTLDMGQNIDKLKNSINSFYETANKWNSMTNSEQADFLTKNAELFSGEGGANLLQAFETGDYSKIEQALGPQLKDQVERTLSEVRKTLAVEEARTGKDRNEANIKKLKEYERFLTDQQKLYKASLDLQLKQEKDQVSKYKEFLQDQQKALKESLEQRKKAYEDYFNAIEKTEEDEEYYEKASLLKANLSKLGSSTDATSINQTRELETKLRDLENERLKELRSRAREAVIDSMDDNLDQINQKFDKLLESNQALLLAMRGDLQDPAKFVSNLIGNKINSGATALEVQDYIRGLQSTYGNLVGNNVDWNNVSVQEKGNTLILNVAGKEIVLSETNQQNLFEVIMKALREIGER